MVRVKIVKRCLALSLIAIGVIISLLPLGCGEKESKPSEEQVTPRLYAEQVMRMTREYLISQPGQLYCWATGDFTRTVIKARFDDAMFDHGRIQYNGDGLWLVNICGQWQVNEITGEVIPQNDEAKELLADLNLKSYTNAAYGYCIRYPTSWNVEEYGDTVHISLSLQEYISIGVLPRGTLPASDFKPVIVDGMIAGLRNEVKDFQLTSETQLSEIGDDAWEIVYTGKTEDNSAFIIKFRLILYKDRLYGITALSTGYEFTSELESSINSFHLSG